MSDDEIEVSSEIKVVLLGESGVGKSSIIKQYVNNVFDPDINASISSKYISKEVFVKDLNKKLKLNLWDTAGQEKYRALVKIFYKDAQIIIFVYNIINLESFESLKTFWYKQVKENCLKNAIFAVVGNKSDLYNQSQVKEEEAREWADSINAIFQLTSARTNSGIDLLFQNLSKKFLDPDFDYKKDDEEDKNNYEKKKKEQEENKKKEKEEDEEDDTVKIPQIHNITLDKKDIVDDNPKKKSCC